MKITLEDSKCKRLVTLSTRNVTATEVLRDFCDVMLGMGFLEASVNLAISELNDEMDEYEARINLN